MLDYVLYSLRVRSFSSGGGWLLIWSLATISISFAFLSFFLTNIYIFSSPGSHLEKCCSGHEVQRSQLLGRTLLGNWGGPVSVSVKIWMILQHGITRWCTPNVPRLLHTGLIRTFARSCGVSPATVRSPTISRWFWSLPSSDPVMKESPSSEDGKDLVYIKSLSLWVALPTM